MPLAGFSLHMTGKCFYVCPNQKYSVRRLRHSGEGWRGRRPVVTRYLFVTARFFRRSPVNSQHGRTRTHHRLRVALRPDRGRAAGGWPAGDQLAIDHQPAHRGELRVVKPAQRTVYAERAGGPGRDLSFLAAATIEDSRAGVPPAFTKCGRRDGCATNTARARTAGSDAARAAALRH